ncbi:MAG: glutamate--tRNA ligase family protein, partial [Candidatus Bathyarchaeota archaeon]|nr:glutamate--tRNA ligase family protein [Candidatus Bathyarchaeota archaeon]
MKIKGQALTLDENLEIREIIRKIALLNALRYGGKAQPKPVLGKLLGECPHLRGKIKEVTVLIDEVVQEVNRLSLEKQRKLVEEKWPELLVSEKVEEERVLPPLPNVEKYKRVVTRFSPNPDFVLHLGSARAIILSYEYAKIYNG